MSKPRRFAFSAALTLGLVCAPAAARAQDTPGPPPFPVTPQPQFPGTPLGPVLVPVSPQGSWGPNSYPPPASPLPSSKHWYGWQILAPTLPSQVAAMTSLTISGFAPSPTLPLTVLGFVGAGISGPIVHLVHQQPMKALASFGLEAALPAALLIGGIASAAACADNDAEDICIGPALLLLIGLPIALSAGLAIDSAALAWEDRPATSAKAPAVNFSVAPLALPPLRLGAAHLAPPPVGIALVGTF